MTFAKSVTESSFMSYFSHTFIFFLSSLAISTRCSCFSQHRTHWKSSYHLSDLFSFLFDSCYWPLCCCDINTMTKKQIAGMGGALIPVHRLPHSWRVVEAGARSRSLRGIRLTDSLGELFIQPSPTCLGLAPPTVGWASPLFTSSEGNAQQTGPQAISRGSLFQVSLINHQD